MIEGERRGMTHFIRKSLNYRGEMASECWKMDKNRYFFENKHDANSISKTLMQTKEDISFFPYFFVVLD